MSKRYDPNKAPKPVPKTNYSKRYDDLKPVVDTGMTVPKLIAQLKNRMPSGEIFRRIRPKKLVELLALHAYELQEKERLANQENNDDDDLPDNSAVPQYHHMHSSIVFNDEKPASRPAPARKSVDCPFILLDVRDEEEFENCHIQNASNYPKARLSRATGQFTPEILQFKGHPEKMIVVYCDYGQTSAEAAQMFAEREFDNIFLLHGGLAEFAEEFPNLCGPNAPPKPLNHGKGTTSQHSAATKSATGAARAARAPAKKPSRAMQAVAHPAGSKPVFK
ncbi:Rhodanese-like domain containing protein [Tritrichomonas foetus]|uniref:Rhodanese-like domain containing protein n=1 Tax=Tritrichomonas foetus TaxID=1144522 RepID=A0A1J4KRS8_9EUKA|nr:Rhodanese-like domain containing protein [Tritrichomonas foetus]|eukprot:OHT12524.1 Rhodanese-like domain containing protein [Tritrichomonas foetus]